MLPPVFYVLVETDYAIGVDGQIKGFPTCLEARGVIYNADAIEAITGETFNPDDYKTLDSFKELLEKLKEGGMETPTGIMNAICPSASIISVVSRSAAIAESFA